MLFLLNYISKQAYETAKKRGKDVSVEGCISALNGEFDEFFKAVKRCDRHAIDAADCMTDDKDFVSFYGLEIHNTALDELADVLITTATWSEADRRGAAEKGVQQRRNYLLGIVADQVRDYVRTQDEADYLFRTVYLKMRFNQLRKD